MKRAFFAKCLLFLILIPLIGENARASSCPASKIKTMLGQMVPQDRALNQSVSEDGIKVTKITSPDSYHILEYHLPKSSIKPYFQTTATLDENGLLWPTLRTKQADGTRSEYLRGTPYLEETLQHFGEKVKGIAGHWQNGKSLDSNLIILNQLLIADPDLTPEAAALKTWTGSIAKSKGFQKVDFHVLHGTRGQYTEVVVKFIR